MIVQIARWNRARDACAPLFATNAREAISKGFFVRSPREEPIIEASRADDRGHDRSCVMSAHEERNIRSVFVSARHDDTV
jgi:hypothetical protein